MKNQRLAALIVEHFFLTLTLRRINLQIKHLEPHFFVVNIL